MKKDRKCDSCHAQVTARTTSWIIVQRTTRAFVDSDWSRNSASRSCIAISTVLNPSRSNEVKTHPLEYLLPPDILQPAIQIPHLLHQLVYLALIRALNFARLANRQIQRKLDGAVHAAAAQPAAARLHVLGRHTDPVLARVGGREGEAAATGAPLGDDAVVVVEGFLDGYKDADVGLGLVGFGVVVPDFGVVVACSC